MYLDAALPDPGQSLFDLFGEGGVDPRSFPDMEAASAYVEKLHFDPREIQQLPKTYILCTESEFPGSPVLPKRRLPLITLGGRISNCQRPMYLWRRCRIGFTGSSSELRKSSRRYTIPLFHASLQFMREARVLMPKMRQGGARFVMFPARPCPAGGSWGSHSCENLRVFSTILHNPAFFVGILENR